MFPQVGGQMMDGTLPQSFDGCQCSCHRTPGVIHVAACCGPGRRRMPRVPEERGDKWRSISTAPTDGAVVIVGAQVAVCPAYFAHGAWRNWFKGCNYSANPADLSAFLPDPIWFEPTHWQAMPEPPGRETTSQKELQSWMPIETCDTDADVLVLDAQTGGMAISARVDAPERRGFRHRNGFPATHWQPLPKGLEP